MKELLSFKSIRLLQIAEKLITSDNYVSFDEFQKINACSNKTVYDDLKNLKDEWNDLLEIDIIKNKARSEKTSISSLISMKQKLYQQEIKIQLLLNIFFYPDKDLLDMSLMMNYSDSYLRTQISQINLYLIKFKSQVTHDKINKTYYLESQDNLILLSMISELIDANGLDHEMEKLSTVHTGPFENYLKSFQTNINKKDLYSIFKPLRIENFLIKRSTSKEDSTLIFNQVLEYEPLFSSYLKKYFLLNNFSIDDEEFQELVNIFITATIKLKMKPIRVDNFLNRYDYFLETFIKENPIKTKEFISAIDHFALSTKIDYEAAKSEILFNVFTRIQSLRKFREFKIAIHSDMGDMHAQSLIIALEKHFATHHFTIYSETDSYDFIISTTENSSKMKDNKIISISDYLSRQDIFNIHQIIYMPS